MAVVEGLYYSKDHEWIKVEGDTAYIGITDYAQQSLGEVVYVEFPEEGDEFGSGEAFGVIESVKAAADSYMPVSGKIIGINDELLEDEPQALNEKPYEAWILKVELTNHSELEDLLSAEDYTKHCEEE